MNSERKCTDPGPARRPLCTQSLRLQNMHPHAHAHAHAHTQKQVTLMHICAYWIYINNINTYVLCAWPLTRGAAVADSGDFPQRDLSLHLLRQGPPRQVSELRERIRSNLSHPSQSFIKRDFPSGVNNTCIKQPSGLHTKNKS